MNYFWFYQNFHYLCDTQKTQSMADKYKIPFINACIRAFAKRIKMPVKNLEKYKGFDFLLSFYSTLHLQSVEDTVDDLKAVCRNNGGCL